MTTRSRLASRPLTVLCATVALLVGFAVQPNHASARIPRTDFPSKPEVKAALGGEGSWTAAFYANSRSMGAKPKGCRSDLQMLAFREDRGRFYFGHETGRPAATTTQADVVIYRYRTIKAARKALTNVSTYPERCPKVTEWTCTDCDGIDTTWRTVVAARSIGKQSVTWRYRRAHNGKETGFTVVARHRAIIVWVEVGRVRYPLDGPFRYPQRIRKAEVLDLTDGALARAREG